jgi:hypothetical protein
MKNSTILVVSTLALGGIGAYFYFKNKKTTASDTTATTPTNTTATTTPTSTTATTPTNDAKALQDLGVKVEEPKPTPYVAPSVPVPTVTLENIQKALLSLGIDQTRSITELASPNYIEAKRIAGNMKEIDYIQKNNIGLFNMGGGSGGTWSYKPETLSKIYQLSEIKVTSSARTGSGGGAKLSPSFADILSIMTKKVNTLGYKVLPNFDIEKM